MSKKILSLVLCICMLTGVLSGCDGEKTQGKESETEKATAKTLIPEEKQGGILNVALSAVPASLDPIKYTSVYESQIICMVCDTLLCYNSDMALSPSLATQWKANEAGDVYTFTLRDDVYFQKGKYQDGRKMTAEDVKYSLERSAKESALQRLSMLDYCQVISDTEIECHLKSPNASFLSALNNGGNVIIPKEEAEGWGDGFSAHLVGTGPFAMKEYISGQSTELTRHDKYWGGKPNLDGVMLSYIPDVTERAQALISKEIHVALDLKGEAISLVKETPWLKVNEVPGMQISYIYFNQKEGVTTDVRVREAMIKALDIDNMVKKLYVYGEGSREYMPLSPLSWGYDPNLIPLIPEYDPEGAKALLTEAGYPNGFSIEFYIPDSPSSITTGMIFQQYMKKNLNIDVELITAPWGPFSDMAVSGKAPIISMSWTWDPDPYFYLNKMFHSSAIGSLGNCQGYSNPQVDKLLDEAVKISDIEERAELYRRALKIIINDRAQIDFSHSKIIVGVSENVQDFKSYSDNSLVICSPEINTWLSE